MLRHKQSTKNCLLSVSVSSKVIPAVYGLM